MSHSLLHTLRRDDGMTLIDLSVALLIIGLIGASFLYAYNEWKSTQASRATIANFGAIEKAIGDFYFTEDRYPCPADPALSPESPDFGVENSAVCPLTGMVPFRTLRLPAEYMLDGWKRKISYTVSTPLTAAGSASSGTVGTLTINRHLQNATGECAGDPDDIGTVTTQAHYVLLTHGERGIGAYELFGNQLSACSPGIKGESENCNGDAIFLDSYCVKNDLNNELYYDDVLYYSDTSPSRIWSYSTVDPNDIFSKPGINVGVGRDDPQHALDVTGNILTDSNDPAKSENVNAGSYCDANGENCFTPEIIGGAGIGCGTNGMAGIANNDALCNTGFSASTPGTCDAGKFVTGFTSGGGILCSD